MEIQKTTTIQTTQTKEHNATKRYIKTWIFGKNTKENQQISSIMEKSGCQTLALHTMEYLEELVNNLEPDILVLCSDVVSTFGEQLIRTLRNKEKYFGILSIGRREHLDECLKTMEAGGNDFIRTPFSPKELLARTKKIVLQKEAKAKGRRICREKSIQIGDLKIDTTKKLILNGTEEQTLTQGEVEIITKLYECEGKTLNRKELVKKQNEGTSIRSRSIDVRISKLKRKMKALSPNIDYIKTIRGEGYLLERL